MRSLLRFLPSCFPSLRQFCKAHQSLLNARVLVQYQCLNLSTRVSETNILLNRSKDRHTRNIFRVEQLPNEATEEALREFYSQFGLILSCRLVRDEKTEQSMSHAFLTFATKEALEKALATRPHVILGQPVISRSARLCQLIIENLPSKVTENSLKAFYVKFGRVANCVVLNGAEIGSKIGFVMYHDEESLDLAMSAMPHVIEGKQVEARICHPSKFTLFISKLSPTTTNACLQEVFSKIDPGVKCTVKVDPKTGMSRGFGYLRFSSEKELQSALDAQPYVISGESVQLAYKEAFHKLFIPALPSGITEESLKVFFSRFDPDVSCQMAREKETNRLRDFATVTFSTQEMLEQAKLASPFTIEGKSINALDGDARRTKKCAIFVGGLAFETTEASFRNFFAKFGSIVDASIKWDKEKNRSRGFGFVTYSTVRAAQNALAGEPYRLDGRRIGVKLVAVPPSNGLTSSQVPFPCVEIRKK